MSLVLIILQTVFLTFKLTGTVAWSWWFVMSPMLLAFGMFIAFVVFAVIVTRDP